MTPSRCFLSALALLTAASAPAQQSRATRPSPSRSSGVLARIALPGGSNWDHITAASDTRRLYLAHDSHIDVLDLDGDTLVAVIRNAKNAHGVALAPGVGRGYTSNGGDSTLSVFDLKTYAILGRIHLKEDAPDGIAYDSYARRVFAMHADRPSMSVIDATSNTLIASVPLGDTPDGAVADEFGHLFIALKPTSQLVVLDTRALKITRRWSLAPCKKPDAITFDHLRQQVLLGCNNKIAMVINATTGGLVSTFPIGLEVDGISIDAEGNAVVSCGDGTLHFAQRHGDTFVVTRIVHTPPGAPNSALDLKRRRVFVPTAALNDSVFPRSRARGKHPAFGLLVIGQPAPAPH